MHLWKSIVGRKIQKIKSKSDAKLKITIVFLCEKQQKWVAYRQTISSTTNTIFISILRFEGAWHNKAPRAISKQSPISKKLYLPFFWLKAKI